MFTAREQEALDEVKRTFIKRGFLIQQSELDLIKSVGRGAAGQTYLAKYKDHDVAVKKYSQDILRNDLPSVINEMKFMLDLEHKNIVPFEGIVLELEPPSVMLVSTFAINGDLLDAIHRRKKFADSPLEEKVVTAMGIAEGCASSLVACSTTANVDSRLFVGLGSGSDFLRRALTASPFMIRFAGCSIFTRLE
mmetsp:Transcript_21656/g.88337  ORF Transcript_21656/g.88337 Transcript_21656/m.88337 type:complete len:193 (-) Transcript_21656:1175-1753(-)